jgi:hypothetical protein
VSSTSPSHRIRPVQRPAPSSSRLAGKTTLAKALAGHIVDGNYDSSLDYEEFTFKGRVFGSIIVAPGITYRRERKWPQIKTAIVNGQIFGIINVVAGGYNTLRELKISMNSLYSSGMTDPEFMTEYVREGRQSDFHALKDDLSELLKSALGRTWFVTAILKQDLWMENYDEVMKFYAGDGCYAALVSEIAKVNARANYECLPASLVIEEFKTKDGRLLAETIADFDYDKQAKSALEFYKSLNQFILRQEI